MSLSKNITVISVLCVTVQGAACAAQADSAAAIVVTATRTAQIADQSLAPVILIDRETIERSSASDAADLLRLHAGLDIGRNGGPGQATSIFMRGTESNHTLVMIDGVKINPGSIGGAALQNISPDMIERIEVVKGPRSSLYGSEAIGGVINIITRQGGKGTRGYFAFGAGRYGSHSQSLGVHLGDGVTRAGIDAAALSTDGFPTRQDASEERGYDNLSFNLYAGRDFGPLDVELRRWQTRGNTEYFDFFLTPLDQDFNNSATSLKLKATPRDTWATSLQLSQSVDEIDQNQSNDFAHTRRNQLDWQNDMQLDERQLLTAGVMLSREDVSSSIFGSGFDETTDVQAVYAQDDIHFGDHHLLLAGRYTDHDSFGGHTTWDVEYGYQLSERTRFTAAAGTAFRAPDATDRYGFGGNPALDPETSRNLELGARHRISERQDIAFSLFDNRIEDLIEFTDPDGFLGPLPGANQNVDKARIRGVEVTYNINLHPFSMRVEGIVQDPENETSGEALPRRAKRSLTTSLLYQHGAYQLGADLITQSQRKDSAFSSVDNAGYGLVNLTAQWRLQPDWRLIGKIENVFNKHYELADGFNTMGRALFIEARYSPAS